MENPTNPQTNKHCYRAFRKTQAIPKEQLLRFHLYEVQYCKACLVSNISSEAHSKVSTPADGVWDGLVDCVVRLS